MMNHHIQRGFTLIEILIVLTISAIMLLGIAKIFDITKRGYIATESQSRMQENARLALYLINRDFRQAGLMGCRSGLSVRAGSVLGTENLLTSSHENNFFSGSGSTTTLNSVVSERVTSSPSSWVPSNTIVGTDVITIRGAFSAGRLTTASAAGTNIPLDNSDGFFTTPVGSTFDRLLITDCQKVSAVKVDAAATAAVTANANLMATYPTGSEVFKLDTAVYFIRNDGGVPSLWRKLNTSPANVLVEGVENLRLLFGQDTNDDARPDRFVAAGTAGLDMNQVVALRIAILVRSLRNDVDLGAHTQSPDLLGSTLTFNDALRRDVYTMTISFRNSVIGI